MSSKRPTDRVVVAYVPVIHDGYRRFFKAQKAKHVYVLGTALANEFDVLRKEIRALPMKDVVTGLKALGIPAKLVDAKTLKRLAKSDQKIIMPDEDVSRTLAEKYLPNSDVTFRPVFLRWDRKRSLAKRIPKSKATVSQKALDKKFIRIAKQTAQQSSDWWRRVGAVAVKDGKILLSALNQQSPSPHSPWSLGDPRNDFRQGEYIDASTSHHAEAGLVSQAAKDGISLKGADVYLTDFPCPPCAKLLAYSGIIRLYFSEGYALLDGEDILKSQGVEVFRVEGVKAPEDPAIRRPYQSRKS